MALVLWPIRPYTDAPCVRQPLGAFGQAVCLFGPDLPLVSEESALPMALPLAPNLPKKATQIRRLLGLLQPYVLGLLACCLPATALAAAPVADDLLAPQVPTIRPLVSWDWHGDLRLRAETLAGVRLATDPYLPSRLDLRHGAGDPSSLPEQGSSLMETADLRLRLNPVLHVGEWTDVISQVDLGRGVVLGGSPQPSDLIGSWTGVTGQSALKDGVAVRRLSVRARLLGMAEVEIGRVGDHFGMGMVRNAGGDLLSDFQSDVDRLAIRAEVFGLRLMIARDTLTSLPALGWGQSSLDLPAKDASGKPTTTPVTSSAPFFTLQDATDTTRWVAEVGGGKVKNDQGLIWNAAILYTTQELGLSAENNAGISFQTTCKTGDCITLSKRNARVFTPQMYLDWHGNWSGRAMRWQLEGAMVYGSFDNIGIKTETAADTGSKTAVDSPLTWISGGLAIRGEMQRGAERTRLDLGAASGNSNGGFGVNDSNPLTVDGSGRPDAALRTFMSGFVFHRDFRVDGLLFRDIIGAVANAAYVKIGHRHAFLQGTDDLGIEASVLGAIAPAPSATTGNSGLLGIEPELTLDYHGPGGNTALLRGSWLVPGPAFAVAGHAAHQAGRLEAVWRLQF